MLQYTTQSALRELAVKLFDEIENNKALKKEAEKLDNMISKAQLSWKVVRSFYKKVSTYYYSIPNALFKDANEAPFAARLEEIRNIARINCATCQIISGNMDNIQLAKHVIRKVKTSIKKKYQFFGTPKIRIKALEDWMFAMGIDDDNDFNQVQTGPLAINESIEYQLVQFVQIEGLLFSVRGLKSVTDGFDLWSYVFIEFLHEINLMNKQQFINRVCQTYENDGGFRKLMNETLKTDCKKWCSDFLQDEQVFGILHLPVIGYLFNIEFQYCHVICFGSKGTVFQALEQPITPPKNICIRRQIFLVVDNRIKNTILAVFFIINDLYVRYLHNLSKREKNIETKAGFLLKIAHFYCEKADSLNTNNHILALSKWMEALKFYEKALNFLPDNPQDLLGYARCLRMLHKYSRAEWFLKKNNRNLQELGEFWTILADVQRHQINKKEDALRSINHGLELQPENVEAEKQRKLINTVNYPVYNKTYIVDSSPSRITSDHRTYNILSIDGGGIRGIMPAVWLCELERKTHRSVATMFDMLTGTSTGGVIAAGLSTPSFSINGRPQYSAADVLNLYTKEHKQLFTENVVSLSGLYDSKYSDEGRKKLFHQYFRKVKLADVLTDLLIPAVSMQTQQIYSFTRRPPQNHHQLFDAVMASSSAPLHFKPYVMDKDYSFVDGGVQANNPSMLAYDEALKYGHQKENIFMLSLGTGDYVPDPIHPDAHRNALFWYSELTNPGKIIFDGPQNVQERHMRDLLQPHYHRWQVWFENPIKLDDCREEIIVYLADTAAEYLEELEAYDNKSRLGLVIEHLRNDE